VTPRSTQPRPQPPSLRASEPPSASIRCMSSPPLHRRQRAPGELRAILLFLLVQTALETEPCNSRSSELRRCSSEAPPSAVVRPLTAVARCSYTTLAVGSGISGPNRVPFRPYATGRPWTNGHGPRRGPRSRQSFAQSQRAAWHHLSQATVSATVLRKTPCAFYNHIYTLPPI
jgi:hypothetical protein